MATVFLVLLLLFCIGAVKSASNLAWMSFYDFNPDVQHGWAYGISSSLKDIEEAYSKYKMQSMFRLPTVHNITQCSTSDYYPIFYTEEKPFGVCPKWSSNLKHITDDIQPFIDNETVNGYFIGDELCCHGVNYTDFVSIIDQIRSSVGNKILIMANECCSTFDSTHSFKWTQIPDGLNYISTDYYNMANGTYEWVYIKQLYEEYVFPLLKNKNNNKYGYDQQTVLVPGIFACNGSTSTINADSEQIIIALNDMFEWAKTEIKIAGFNPWHFDNRTDTGPSHFVVDGCMAGYDTYAPGAIAMPNVVQKLKQIGQYILD